METTTNLEQLPAWVPLGQLSSALLSVAVADRADMDASALRVARLERVVIHARKVLQDAPPVSFEGFSRGELVKLHAVVTEARALTAETLQDVTTMLAARDLPERLARALEGAFEVGQTLEQHNRDTLDAIEWEIDSQDAERLMRDAGPGIGWGDAKKLIGLA